MTTEILSGSKICFIGAGAMATAMLVGICQQGLVKPTDITASDPYLPQLEKLTAQYPINVTQDNLAGIQEKDILILAVKPQMFNQVARELAGHLPAESLVISILGGVTTSKLTRKLQHQRIVRVMPNTPAQVSQGMSVWISTTAVNDTQRLQTKTILSALGEEVAVEKEDFLDMATAISGSGPAYVFMFMEAMIDTGVHLGFPRAMAQQLVYQTIAGSVAFARSSQRHPAELRNMVTSPGGTTAEAIYQLDEGGLRATLSKAIWAAYKKSKLIGSLEDDG